MFALKCSTFYIKTVMTHWSGNEGWPCVCRFPKKKQCALCH